MCMAVPQFGHSSGSTSARTEIAGLARVGEQVIVPAMIAMNTGKALVQVAAVEEALEHLALDGAGD